MRRGAAITLTALVLGAGLVACGGSNDDTTSSGSPVWPGVGGTVAASPADNGGSTTTPPAVGSTVSATTMTQKLQHAADITSTAHVAISAGAGGRNLDAQGDVQTKPLAEDLTVSMMGMDVEVRVVDDTFYVKVPLPGMGAQTWLKATAQELGAQSGLGSLSSLTDPFSMLSRSSDAIRSATYVGTDSTGQHYALTVDTKKLLQDMGVSGSGLSQLGSMPPTVTEDVWFDGDGHVVQAKTDLGTSSTTVTMSDFGKQVEVTAPPAGQVRDLSSLGGLSGLSGL